MKNIELTVSWPGAHLMSCKAGFTVLAEVLTAPDTNPSA